MVITALTRSLNSVPAFFIITLILHISPILHNVLIIQDRDSVTGNLLAFLLLIESTKIPSTLADCTHSLHLLSLVHHSTQIPFINVFILYSHIVVRPRIIMGIRR